MLVRTKGVPHMQHLKEVDKIEITCLVDNSSDLLVMDDSALIQRAKPVYEGRMGSGVLAEHGFSALLTVHAGDESHTVLFDYGLSPVAVPFNMDVLRIDLTQIEAMALSHGHPDHMNGFEAVMEKLPGKPLPLVLHPAAFTAPRYFKFSEEFKIMFPEITRAGVEAAGAEIIESAGPHLLADDGIMFLGEIPRVTDFEKGVPFAYCVRDGEEQWDSIPDDTALVADLRGKGLVVLSGCAHAGIINTVQQARQVTGVDEVHAVMGGFHLTGPAFEPIIGRTVEEMQRFAPDYVVPTHCSGRRALRAFEEAMPEQTLTNLSGTKLTFA
jgi:7,8-dihydropterin-6-yl-methyl-4-(beta-D-ribofuranosyl)aminobenzene 5'-phosphate synthase